MYWRWAWEELTIAHWKHHSGKYLMAESNLELSKLVEDKTNPKIYFKQFYEILKD